MTRTHLYLLAAVVALPPYVTVQSRWVREFAAHPQRAQKRAEMENKFSRLEELRAGEEALRGQREEATRELADLSRASLADPRDPLSWVSVRIHALSQETGVLTGSVSQKGVPQLRVPRGDAPRQFQPFCCQTELSGTLDQITTFLEQMESANPFLRVREFYVGPAQTPDGQRQGYLQMDWPLPVDAAEDSRIRSGMAKNNVRPE